jgi:AcrR family transcriptional regulator
VSRHPTEQKILDATIGIINERGEAAVRIVDIQSACDVTAPSIYHFFGNREGLVIEAQTERLLRSFDANDFMIDAAIDRVSSLEEAREALHVFLSSFWMAERTPARARRLSAMGAAVGRPALAARFDEEIRQYVDVRSSKLLPLQERGWILPDADLHAINYLLIGVIFGRVYLEIGGDSGPFPAWESATERAIAFLLFGPEYADQI